MQEKIAEAAERLSRMIAGRKVFLELVLVLGEPNRQLPLLDEALAASRFGEHGSKRGLKRVLTALKEAEVIAGAGRWVHAPANEARSLFVQRSTELGLKRIPAKKRVWTRDAVTGATDQVCIVGLIVRMEKRQEGQSEIDWKLALQTLRTGRATHPMYVYIAPDPGLSLDSAVALHWLNGLQYDWRYP